MVSRMDEKSKDVTEDAETVVEVADEALKG